MKKYFIVLISLFVISNAFGQQFSELQKARPKLVVGIVVDQMRYDYLYRFYDKYSNDGFKKLLRKGHVCHQVTYDYVPTYTGPGHASIYTGTSPSYHGIISNDWYDRGLSKLINCVSDTSVKTVGGENISSGSSPHRLLATTITDEWKLASPKSKVIGISIKDRSAVLPAGHLGDAAYWLDKFSGKMISSTFYLKELPKWASDFNSSSFLNNLLEKNWTTLRNIGLYTDSRADEFSHEWTLKGNEKAVFPYDFQKIENRKEKVGALIASPLGNELLTEFAVKAIRSEQLGQRSVMDFLCLSYSSPDIGGHHFGPYSIEMEDMYLRLDREISRLIQTLNTEVGEGNYILFLTADHAVTPIPQYLKEKQMSAGYIDPLKVMKTLEDALQIKWPSKKTWIATFDDGYIYFNTDQWKTYASEKQDIFNYSKEILKKIEGISRVYTEDDLQNKYLDPAIGKRVEQGFYSGRSADIIAIQNAHFLYYKDDLPGTSHGSPYMYDSHVPLVWFGKGITPGNTYEPLSIRDIAPTLSAILKLQLPSGCTGKPILGVVKP